jgi:hypothetical protein
MEQNTADMSVEGLIEAQRKLSASKNPFERVIGALCLAGRLKQRLARLPDETIGELMFHVSDELDIFGPELTICQAATERLLNSSPLQVRNSKEEFYR